MALNPEELDLDSAAMQAKYDQTMREKQNQLEKEDLSDMVAEHAAKQKVSAPVSLCQSVICRTSMLANKGPVSLYVFHVVKYLHVALRFNYKMYHKNTLSCCHGLVKML